MIMMAMVIMTITVIVMVTVIAMIERRVMMALTTAFLLVGGISFTVGTLKFAGF